MKRKLFLNRYDIFLKICRRGVQNGLQKFLIQKQLKHALDNKEYIYHDALNNSLKPTASDQMVAHTLVMVWSYCDKHKYALIELLEDILNEEEKYIKKFDGEDGIVTLFTLTQKDFMVKK